MRDFLSDVRFALRSLRRKPGFLAATVLSLGLCLGATTTVFTWMESLILRPFPQLQAAERLIRIRPRNDVTGYETSASYPEFSDWRERSRSLRGVAAYQIAEFGLRGDDPTTSAERVWGQYASFNYFDVLGVAPSLGRSFLPEEEDPSGNAPPVAIMSDELWRSRFDANPDIVGQTVTLNNVEVTVVGIAPPGFRGAEVALALDLWTPLTARPALERIGTDRLRARQSQWLTVFGRLAPGVTLEGARAELRNVGETLQAEHPGSNGFLPYVVGFEKDGAARDAMRPLLTTLLGMTGLVLLIACANLANLLLARTAARRREIGVRLAIGVSRGRLIRQLLTESLVVAALGSVMALAVAAWGRDLLARMIPPSSFPVLLEPILGWRVFLLAGSLALFTTLLFGLLPALRFSRPDLIGALREGSGGTLEGSRLRGALVIAQVALAIVALSCAGLILRGLQHAQQVHPGAADPGSVLLVSTNLRLAGHSDSLSAVLVERLVEKARALPGATAASVATTVPLGFGGWNSQGFEVPGYETAADEDMIFLTNTVGQQYFETIGLPLARGTGFSPDANAAEFQVIVNQAFAERFWPGQDPIGREIVSGQGRRLVVGIAPDAPYTSLTDSPEPFVYLPVTGRVISELTLHVRTAGAPLALVGPLRKAFSDVDPGLPFLDARTMDLHMRAGTVVQRTGATALAAFGFVALALAALGLYAVLAYLVTQRRREIGIRLALGAVGRDVVALVVGDGVRLTAWGMLIGTAGAIAVGRLIGAQMEGVPGSDPLTFALAAVTLAAVALLASWLPARRATRVDPVVALRAE